MNRDQYFAVGWFFFVLMIILIWFHMTFWIAPDFGTLSSEIDVGNMYYTIKFAIISVIIFPVCFSLFILFQILGLLEPKKK